MFYVTRLKDLGFRYPYTKRVSHMEDEELDYGEEDYELKIDDEDDQDLLEGELDEAKYFDEDEEIDIYNDVDTTLKPDEKTSENKLDSTIVKKEVNLTKEDEKLKQDIKDGESSDTNAKQPKSQAAAAQRKTVTKETRKVVQTDGRRAASSEARYLLISEVNWWTTDSEIEAALSEFGTVKEIKFVEEKASGKSKGLCQAITITNFVLDKFSTPCFAIFSRFPHLLFSQLVRHFHFVSLFNNFKILPFILEIVP